MIRQFRPGDRNFVVNSWLRSFQGTTRAGAWLATSDYRAHYQTIVVNLVAASDVDVLVPADAGDDDQILAYACRQDGRLHYLYVKKNFRDVPDQKLGLARQLLEAADLRPGRRFEVTFWTPAWHRLAERYGYVYDHVPLKEAVA